MKGKVTLEGGRGAGVLEGRRAGRKREGGCAEERVVRSEKSSIQREVVDSAVADGA